MSGINWLVSYPKSGNTWVRYFIANMLLESPSMDSINILQKDGISSSRSWMDDAFGFSSLNLGHDELDLIRPEFYRYAAEYQTGGAFYKCHDAFTLNIHGEPIFPPDTINKVLYIIRNPLDVLVSYAAHCNISIDKMQTHMANEKYVLCAATTKATHQSRQLLMDWSSHVLSWVQQPNINLLLIRYEDMCVDPYQTFRKISDFLELSGNKDKTKKAVDACAFNKLKKLESEENFLERPQKAKQFFRQGGVGGWRQYLEDHHVQRVIERHEEVMKKFGYIDENSNLLNI